MSDQVINIRSIQHYMYCAHRWGLMEIDRAWLENYFVTKANLLHERVHDPGYSYSGRGKKVLTSVSVYHDAEEYNLYGVTDCIELTLSSSGVFFPEYDGRFRLTVVEYKPTKPKSQSFREEDLMQVFAQKICIDHIFQTECDGIIYYGDVKKRVSLPLKENFHEYDLRLKELLAEMRQFLEIGLIPLIPVKQHCSGCSMQDLCMPKKRKPKRVYDQIQMLKEEVVCGNY